MKSAAGIQNPSEIDVCLWSAHTVSLSNIYIYLLPVEIESKTVCAARFNRSMKTDFFKKASES